LENCSQIDFNKVKTYLLTTINNLFLNTIKTIRSLWLSPKTPNLDTTNQSPEYLLEEEEFKIKLQNAIASLTEARESFNESY
jgi:RNA polymerase sigma-70 factor (ECF subfamily)